MLNRVFLLYLPSATYIIFDPINSIYMAWTKTANVAQYQQDWSNFLFKQSHCTVEKAKRIAMSNPQITFFFICREGVNLGEQGIYYPGDAVFFMGEPWYGDAPQCDSYQKNGMTIAYVSPNTTFSLKDVASYTLSDGSPAIDIVCLGAGNFATLNQPPYLRQQNFTPPSTDKPLNENIQQALDDDSVSYLQSKGITVMLTIMGAHKLPGWSQFSSLQDANKFAKYLQTEIVEKYGLDGIDIDDEYSNGTPNDYSLIMASSLMKMHMPGKMATKALWADIQYFPPNAWSQLTLLDTLDYGWEMSYGGAPQGRLEPYADAGMSKTALSLGFWSGQPSADPTGDVAWLKTNSYGGIMIFAFEETSNQQLMGELVNAWYGPGNWNKK